MSASEARERQALAGALGRMLADKSARIQDLEAAAREVVAANREIDGGRDSITRYHAAIDALEMVLLSADRAETNQEVRR